MDAPFMVRLGLGLRAGDNWFHFPLKGVNGKVVVSTVMTPLHWFHLLEETWRCYELVT